MNLAHLRNLDTILSLLADIVYTKYEVLAELPEVEAGVDSPEVKFLNELCDRLEDVGAGLEIARDSIRAYLKDSKDDNA